MEKYNMEMELAPDTLPGKMMGRIQPNSTVLEFGCAYGRMTKHMCQQLHCQVYIAELDPEAYACAKEFAEDGYCGDIENGTWFSLFENKKFDYILFADVLEHLRNPAHVLSLAKKLLKPNGEIIVSFPNIAHFDILANLYLNRFQYTKIGLLDDTHIHFWGKADLERFFAALGLQIVTLDGVYVPPYGTEQGVARGILPENVEQVFKQKELNDLYQFFLVIKRDEDVQPRDILDADQLEYYHSDTTGAFYFDFGEGYSEENSLRLVPEIQRGTYRFHYSLRDIPEGCKKIRFTPVYGSYALISDLEILGNTGAYQGVALNGATINGVMVFSETITNIEINLKAGTQWLEITASVVATTDPKMAKLFTQVQLAVEKNGLFSYLNSQREYSEGLIISQQEQLRAKEAEISACRDQLENTKLALMQAQEQGSSLQDALKNTQAHVSQLTEDLANANQVLAQIQLHFERLKEVTNFDTELNDLDDVAQLTQILYDHYHDKGDDTAKLSAELRDMTNYARHVENLYHVLAAQYNAVLGSHSWRVMAPLRKIMEFLKHRMKLMLVYKALRYLKHYGVKATVLKIKEYQNQRKIKVDQLLLPEKIESFAALAQHLQEKAACGEVTVYLNDVLREYDNCKGKKILLVSHELNLTGAPVAVYYFAKVLKENGYYPVMLSPNDGKLVNTVTDAGIPAIVVPGLWNSNLVSCTAQLFQMIVLNTIVTAPVLQQLNGLGVPVFWWIHEAQVSYTQTCLNNMPPILPEGISVYTVGAHAKRVLEQHRPEYRINHLLYYIPDRVKEDSRIYPLPKYAEGKLVFCHIGMLEKRKGQNILADAVLRLPEEIRKQCYFVFVGKQCYPPCYESIQHLQHKFPENVVYIEEVSVQDMPSLYRRIDCFVCSSLDDPMPIVVTEALQFGKPVICSENTGSAELLRKENCGYVYEDNDPNKLAQSIIKVVHSIHDMDELRKAARATYEKYFSQEVFEKNVLSIIEERSSDAQATNLEPLTSKSLSMRALLEEFEQTQIEGDRIYQKELLLSYDEKTDKKRVLLLTHECSLTGAPIALQHLAESFRENGAQVVVLSPFDGPMSREFEKSQIPVIVYQNVYADDFLAQQADKFHFIVLNTVVTYRAVTQLAQCSVPVLWWIHDSKASYEIGGFRDCLPKEIPGNVKIMCGGEYAKKQLLTYYPHYEAGVLLYVSPDQAEESKHYPVYPLNHNPQNLTFAVIGQQDVRKGHDIFAQAIHLLTDEERKRANFYFFGNHLDAQIKQAVDEVCQAFPDQVTYIPQVNRQELFSVYQQMDCIVCSSRDDPMPVFVTEALMMSKVVICSENTGWSSILEKEDCGLVYHDDSAAQLAEKIRYVLSHYQQLQPMAERGRHVYEKLFSPQAFGENAKRLLETMSRDMEPGSLDVTVSVVIPTYNAGDQFALLLQRLQAQKKIRSVEIVIIDSGSTDGTANLCKAYGVRFIPIPHESFTHSYARNKGASLANGELLIFMTQDALPVDEYWMYHLAQPIVSGQAVATSCMEKCPEGTDLYYAAGSWNHARYQGVLDGNRFSTLNKGDSIDDLRPKASLNDVTSMIRADVFRRFLFRLGYAEDLDMGLRLLKAGYSIGLLNTTASVHGHNRTSGYYLKRGYVEARALGHICSLWKAKIQQDVCITAKIVYGSDLLDYAICKTRNDLATQVSLDTICGVFLQNLTEAMAHPEKLGTCQNESKDTLLQWCVDTLRPYSCQAEGRQEELAHHVAYYLNQILRPYMEKNGMLNLDQKQQEAFYDCAEKQFCLACGSILAGIDENSPIYPQIQTLAAGV